MTLSVLLLIEDEVAMVREMNMKHKHRTTKECLLAIKRTSCYFYFCLSSIRQSQVASSWLYGEGMAQVLWTILRFPYTMKGTSRRQVYEEEEEA